MQTVILQNEINVIYSYSNDPKPLKSVMVVVYIAAGLILAGCVLSTLYTNIKGKELLPSLWI